MRFNLVLHSRSLDKLKAVQQEILTLHPGIQVVCIAHDASKAVSNWDKLLEPINNLRITILINNLGVTVAPYNSFERQTDEQIEESIRINNIFPTQLTKHILPILVVNSPALILNIGSGAELAPPPLITVYSATKSYVRTWSTGLRNELRLLGHDVECKLVMTSGVTSGLNRPETFFRPSAEHYARSLLARAGSNGPVYNGYWGHTLKVSVAVVWYSFRSHHSVRGHVVDVLVA
jgi:17beta-estradiol 17-dehydrogenase / very-long-chain 3-oxoacyl-CoA reductase